MNVLDAVLLLIILLAVYAGYYKGFVLGALELLGLTLGLLVALLSYRYIAALFDRYVPSLGLWSSPLAFIIAYVLARLALGALSSVLLRQLPPTAHHSTFNRVLGILPGAINGALYAAIISTLLLAVPLFNGLATQTRDSAIAQALTPPVVWAEQKLAPVFSPAMQRGLQHLKVAPDSTHTAKLPFTVKNAKVREDLEARMLEMVNAERAREGLEPLKADPEMRKVARAHAQDMFANGYFAHINLQGKTPAQRARAAGVRFLTAGENLALAPTLQMAHNGLMNSPGHRANILHPAFGRLGIGILDGGIRGLMVTQNFRN